MAHGPALPASEPYATPYSNICNLRRLRGTTSQHIKQRSRQQKVEPHKDNRWPLHDTPEHPQIEPAASSIGFFWPAGVLPWSLVPRGVEGAVPGVEGAGPVPQGVKAAARNAGAAGAVAPPEVKAGTAEEGVP